eukprot:TRINITY_DN939_c0_g2_i8.p1 TRINITY_DN939_c0_g2~~TRINITY_DN939_c0_g2_i8.p1  ORF type:complete len:110 (-),score=0.36 TRINITY_DN939_c0_g2_i8:484-813(-)
MCCTTVRFFIISYRALSTFLPSYENVAQYCPPPVLPKKIKKGPKLTLVLDLDETLVHASLKPVSEEDKQISVSNGTADVTVTHSLPFRFTLAFVLGRWSSCRRRRGVSR